MKLIELNLTPGVRQLRGFGLVALVALGLLGGFLYWKGSFFGIALGDAAPWVAGTLWAMGIVSGCFSLVYPRANRPLFLALSFIAYPVGYVISHLLMAFLFYGVITPVGLLFRLLGRDPLKRKADLRAESYWELHSPRTEKKSYLRQF